jgi:multimeric flavodoxin WrbA
MYCLILNGNPEAEGAGSEFDAYLSGFAKGLEEVGHETRRLDLRDLDLHNCTGCWSCWWKTPGLCSIKDDQDGILREMVRADLVVWASPLVLGNVSALLKRVQDRFVPLVHPYITIQDGECHHRPRYAHEPDIGLIVGPAPADDETDLAIVRTLFERYARNAHADLRFVATTATPLDATVAAAAGAARGLRAAGPALPSWIEDPLPRETRRAEPRRLFLNGSPRGRESNSRLILSWIAGGMAEAGSGEPQVLDLARKGDLEAQLAAFLEAEEILIVMPLYTDSVPALVKGFFEALARLDPGSLRGKRLAFVLQSGFPESVHSETAALWLRRLCVRLGLAHAGTIVRPGIEGVRIQPDAMVRKTREAFVGAGAEYAASGTFPATLSRGLAGRRRFSALGILVYGILARTGLANFYWDMMLRKNGAFDRRFAAPYGAAWRAKGA